METISALLTYCNGNASVSDGLPLQRVCNEDYGVFFVISRNELWPHSRLAREIRRLNAHMTYCKSLSRRIFIFVDNGIPYLFINQLKMQ